jgi:hypothetical protein
LENPFNSRTGRAMLATRSRMKRNSVSSPATAPTLRTVISIVTVSPIQNSAALAVRFSIVKFP